MLSKPHITILPGLLDDYLDGVLEDHEEALLDATAQENPDLVRTELARAIARKHRLLTALGAEPTPALGERIARDTSIRAAPLRFDESNGSSPMVRSAVAPAAPRRIRRSTLLVIGGLVLASAAATALTWSLPQLAAQRRRIEALQRQYEDAWAAIEREFAAASEVRSTVLPAADGAARRVRVELCPCLADGRLVRQVDISWDRGGAIERVFDLHGAGSLAASHDYVLPATGTALHEISIDFVETDALHEAGDVASSLRRVAATVVATPDGITIEHGHRADADVARAMRDGKLVEIVAPPPHSDVIDEGLNVTLRAPRSTGRITLLVRRGDEPPYYVQPGARKLGAGAEARFVVDLDGGPTERLDETFQILVVASDVFKPTTWALDEANVPFDDVVAELSLRKVAGVIRSAAPSRFSGAIATPDGAVIVLREGEAARVMHVLAPRSGGGSFDKPIDVSPERLDDLRLLVRRPNGVTLPVERSIVDLNSDHWWIYPLSR